MKEELEKRQEWVGNDKLQSKLIVKSGHLLGSTPGCLNKEDLEESIMAQPIMKNIEIEVRIEFCRLTNRKKFDQEEREQSVKAAHIWVAWDKARQARAALNYIYGGQNSAGYPLGRKMVFVPNPYDTRFPMTAVSKARYLGLIAKQRTWLRKIIVFRIQGIRGLDYPIREANDKTL